MKKITLLLFFLLSLFQCAPPANQKKPPVAVKGVLDLRPSATLGNQGWDFEKGGIVSLDGEWEFYWEEFLDPTNVVGAEYIQPLHEKINYISVPNSWNGHNVSSDGDIPKIIDGDGHATYRLRFLTKQTSDLSIQARL